MIKIIGLIVGFLIAGSGIFYFFQNKNDDESKKIYGITVILGIVIIVISLFM